MQKTLLFLFVFLFLQSASGQYEEKNFVHYTVRHGLSENYITCLSQDEWGYLWIGTDIGLNRFDGHGFKNFFQGTKSLPLLSGTISKLKLFDRQHLGILNHGGFQLLNTKDLSVKNFVIPDTTAFSVYRNAAWDAVELPGKSFAVTTASGFYVFDASGKLDFRHDAYQLKDIGQERILYGRDIFKINDEDYLVFINGNGIAYYNSREKSFNEISTGNLWPSSSGEQRKWSNFIPVASKNNFNWTTRYQINRDEFIFMQFGHKNLVYFNHALNKTVVSPCDLSPNEFSWESKITMINDSSFLVNGGYTGFFLFYINRKDGKITMNSKKFLPGHKIQCLYQDKDKRLWVGTSKGLLQEKLVTPVLRSFLFRPSASDSLTGGLSCAFRHKDKLYIGRYSLNKGLIIADTATGKIIKQVEFYGKNTQWNEISSIQMYHPDTLWIGTNAGLLWFDTKTMNYGKLSDKIKYTSKFPEIDMLAPVRKDGYAWMCSFLGGVVARYHIASGTFTFFTSKSRPALPFDNVKSIAYDAYGDVWISGHSLARWNTQKQYFDTLISVYSGPNKYEENILAMIADNNGSLWLHNALNGLLEYRIKEKRFVSHTMKDGLPTDVFYGFSPIINNNLWMAGNNSLTKFDIHTNKNVVYDYQDGLPDDKPSGRYPYYDSSGGVLYLFYQHVLTAMSIPEPQPADYGNALMIEDLIVNNKQHFFFPVGDLRLKPGQNNLSLHFGIINFESGSNYQFAYKLNESENWTDLGGQRNIILTGLSPGSYTVWLKATGKSGEQKIQHFSFAIAPPFWKTGWFLASCILLLLTFLYLVYRYRIDQIRQKSSIDRKLSQTEMKALHAQMNPHFIFNSLNSIRKMILTNENKEASHFLGKFAQLIRITLDQSGQSFVTLRDTMAYLNRYIEMEQIRNSQFTCRILADDELDLDETTLPPMLIQPFIENAIWHGSATDHKNININIDFKKSTAAVGQNNQLVCTIEDNGIGINSSMRNKTSGDDMHHSVGIKNITTRIQILNEKYNIKSSVTIADKSDLPNSTGTGTLVTLRLPLEISPNA